MVGLNFIRIAAVAIGLSTLSFAAGVAGDLSIIDPPRSGQRVVLRLPPEIPADAPRAAPLPPLLSTASAQASPAPQLRFDEPESVTFDEIIAIELAHEPEHAAETFVAEAAGPAGKPFRDLVLVTVKPHFEDLRLGSDAKPA